MFHIVSNPFVEMTQGVVSSGLGYIAERSEKSRSFAWVWWIVAGILATIGLVILSNYQDKEYQKELDEELRKFEEKKIKALNQ